MTEQFYFVDAVCAVKRSFGKLHLLERWLAQSFDTMNFERLPNELLLSIFDYLNGFDLLRSFIDLNAHFHALLFQQHVSYCFDLKRVRKHQFDLVCQQYLPCVGTQTIALKLDESAFTVGAVNLFFHSYVPSLSSFTRLRSLSIVYHCSNLTATTVLQQLPHLLNLEHFRLGLFHICDEDAIDDRLLIDAVWCLPKLVHCDVSASSDGPSPLCVMPSMVSSSLQHLSTLPYCFRWSVLDQLLHLTPNLRSLCVHMFSWTAEDYIQFSSFPTLIKLTVTVARSPAVNFLRFLQTLPNLRYLDANLSHKLIDGHQWQRHIRAHLPHLQTLHFLMESDSVGAEQAEQFIDTFRGPFWTKEHHWFVRCFLRQKCLHVRTIVKPDCFFDPPSADLFRSTDPHDSEPKAYEQLTSIWDSRDTRCSLPAGAQRPRVTQLLFRLPTVEQLWPIFTQFEQLTRVSVHNFTGQFVPRLQAILDRASRLRCLSIARAKSEPIDTLLLLRTPSPVARFCVHDRKMNEAECRILSRAPLARQCHALSLCPT